MNILRSIFIDTPDRERLVRHCLRHTVERNPGARIIIGIDVAPETFDGYAKSLSDRVEVHRLPPGNGSRLHKVMPMLAAAADGEHVVTAEQDTIFDAAEADKALAVFPSLPGRTAALTLTSRHRGGALVYPFKKERSGPVMPNIPGEIVKAGAAVFSCAIWNLEALRSVPWGKLGPTFWGVDDSASRWLISRGWGCYISREYGTFRHYSQSDPSKLDRSMRRSLHRG